MIGYFDIKGEINNPGVYKIEKKITINDAIEIAGGLTKKSDTSKINLSKQVKDEMVIFIFNKSNYIIKTCNCKKVYKNICNKPQTTSTYETKTSLITNTKLIETTMPTTSILLENKIININTASLEELLTIKGLGLVKSENIIKYREENGLFESIDSIKNVSGIGVSLFEKIKNYITI